MDDGIAALAEALEDVARRNGRSAAVNREAAIGDVAVTLSRTRDGRIAMLRQPLPGEGGRVTLNYPDGRMHRGSLSHATLAWAERWAREDLEGIARHARLMASLGLPPDAFHPAAAHVSRPLARLARHAGCDLAEVLAAGVWKPAPEGYAMSVVHPAFAEEAVFHRYLGEVTTTGVVIEMDAERIEMADERGRLRMSLRTGSSPPDTILIAARERGLAEFVTLPGDAGEGCVIKACETKTQGVLTIIADCPRDTLIQGDRT